MKETLSRLLEEKQMGKLLKKAILRRLDYAEILAELQRQYDAFC